MTSCFNDNTYFVFIVSILHFIFYICIAIRFEFATSRWKYLATFDFSVILICFINTITQHQWFSNVTGQVIGTLVLADILNVQFYSFLGVLKIVLFVFLSTNAWNALTGTVETVSEAHLGLELYGYKTLIVIIALIVLIVLIYIALLYIHVPQTISHLCVVALVSFILLPSIRILVIFNKDPSNTKYCFFVDEYESDSNILDRNPLIWPAFYWGIFAGLTIVALIISYRFSFFRKDKKKKKKEKIEKERFEKKQKKLDVEYKKIVVNEEYNSS